MKFNKHTLGLAAVGIVSLSSAQRTEPKGKVIVVDAPEMPEGLLKLLCEQHTPHDMILSKPGKIPDELIKALQSKGLTVVIVDDSGFKVKEFEPKEPETTHVLELKDMEIDFAALARSILKPFHAYPVSGNPWPPPKKSGWPKKISPTRARR